MLQQTTYTSKFPCTNCGIKGHHYRQCIAPIYSYGIIAFRHRASDWNQVTELSQNDTSFTGFKTNEIEFLLIQRKDSIGYIELIRGKYKLQDIQYITEQVAGTTAHERAKLSSMSFHELWCDVWGEENQKYKTDLEQAKLKFEMIRSGYICETTKCHIKLSNLFEEIPCKWDTPEWGFPKGRRNPGETDFECACREFREETGVISEHFRVFENIEPFRETFFGNNHIQYSHVYYIGWIPSFVNVEMKKEDNLLCQEVGGIGWFSLDDALAKIRPTNIEKREILLRVSSALRNLSCLLIGPLLGQGTMGQTNHLEAGNTNRKDGFGGATASAVASPATTKKEITKTSGAGCPIKRTTEGTTYQFVEDKD